MTAMRLPRCTISKLFAIWFVVLIVLPCTAPFQTVDFAAPVGNARSHVLLSADKLAKDTTTPSCAHLVVPFFFSVAVRVESLNSGQQRRQVVCAVLRL